MSSPQVVEKSVNVNNNSSFQNCTNLDDHTRQTTLNTKSKLYSEKTSSNTQTNQLGIVLQVIDNFVPQLLMRDFDSLYMV